MIDYEKPRPIDYSKLEREAPESRSEPLTNAQGVRLLRKGETVSLTDLVRS